MVAPPPVRSGTNRQLGGRLSSGRRNGYGRGVITVADNTFLLTTDRTSYAFAVDPAGFLRHLHWGARVDRVADFDAPAKWDLSTNDMLVDVTAEEYPVHGQFRSKEQCLAVRFADGTRELQVAVVGHRADGDELVVTLTDELRELSVDLHYRVHESLDLIERWAVVRNEGTGSVVVESAFSAQFHVPHEGLTFRNVQGLWAAEQQAFTQPVGPGKIVIEARRGISTHHHNPYVILDRQAGEIAGEVWFAALRHSGNFKGIVEQRPYGGTLFQLGLNDYDSELTLRPGEDLVTPAVVAGYTGAGLGAMSHHLHAFGRSLMTPGLRDVLYNSWEATGFDVSADNQIALARRAKDLGVELFVVDDGWFGRRGADSDGLGDWWANPEKFPDGLAPLIAAVHDVGLKFGIWVEPEMVNPNADLFAEHPDWIYRQPDREPDQARQQYVLNLTKPAVQDFAVDMLDRLLAEHEIDYVKWDANRPMSQVGVDRDVWFRHVTALYEVVRRVKQRHPDVLIEACASGGGRVDFGALTVFDDFWPSDNTDARDRLDIQRGYSFVYPAKAMRAWVTDSPNFLTQRAVPLKFQFHVAMMGTLGIGADLTKLAEDELKQAAKLVAKYQEIRATVQDGDFHRLDNPSPNDYRLFQYSAADQAVLFVFLPASLIGRHGTRAQLRGLDPDATYRFYSEWMWQERSGAYLMAHGIPVWLQGDDASELIVFDRLS